MFNFPSNKDIPACLLPSIKKQMIYFANNSLHVRSFSFICESSLSEERRFEADDFIITVVPMVLLKKNRKKNCIGSSTVLRAR